MSPPPTIRPERDGDFPAIEAVLDAAFEGTDESRIVREVRDSDAYLPLLTLVAEENGEVVGYALSTRGWLVGEELRRPILCLGPVAVRPDRQLRGIGTALNDRELEEARRAGESLVVVVGHPEYYPRFGFERASAQGITCPFPGVPDEAFMVLHLTEECRSWPGEALYPPAFGCVSGQRLLKERGRPS